MKIWFTRGIDAGIRIGKWEKKIWLGNGEPPWGWA